MITENNDKPCLLYVEDDETLSFITRDNLELMGYKVIHYDNGQIAFSNFTNHRFQLCLLDVMLPRMDGFELARKIRMINPDIPIIFLTAKSQQNDKIEGLQTGADDYITKPFDMEELRLKIEIFLKRPIRVKPLDGNLFSISGFILDPVNQKVHAGSKEIKLTHRESRLMEYFFSHVNQLLPRQQILMQIWGEDSYFSGRSLDVYVSKLRKILKLGDGLSIENVHGTGFRLMDGSHVTNNQE